MTSTDRQPGWLDFRRAIICALPHEFDAVEALFDENYCNVPSDGHHRDSNYYRTGRIGADYVVLTCLAEMGKGDAVYWIYLIGQIGRFGLFSLMFRRQVNKFDSRRSIADTFSFLDRKTRYGDTRASIEIVYFRRRVNMFGELVMRLRLARRCAPRPLVHLGPIASGDTVIKSARHRDALARNSGIIGFEMEGAGVCDSLSCLIIKGACDYADSHKNDVWQHYAAASAAACAKSLLRRLAELRLEYNLSANMISRTMTDTYDAVQHVQSVKELLRRFGDGIPNEIMRHALVPVASNMARLSRSGIQDLQKTKLFKSYTRRTMFGTICFQNQVIDHRVIAGDEYSGRTETKTAVIFHPTSTWRYIIQPVHAVPDNSLIFRFCETGNVDAVRELFSRDDASVFDTDTLGWGPLHYAANRGQFEMARFLILEGPDKRASAYYLDPASLISASRSSEKMIDLLFLFEDCINFWDETDTGWSVLSTLQTSRGRINPNLARDCCSFLLQKYRAEGTEAKKLDAVCWALAEAYRNKQYGCMQTLLEFDPTFQGFSPSRYEEAEGEGIATFMAWFGDNFLIQQKLIDRGIDLMTDFHGETPTSRSLRFGCMFFGWHGEARVTCADVDRLLARETSEGGILTSRGWRYDTLRNLFFLEPSAQLTDMYGNNRFCLQDPLHYPSCVVPECPEPAYDIDYHGIVVEPWWEELKHLFRAGKCVCFVQQWVSDGRDASQIRHNRCQEAVMDLGVELDTDKMLHESLDSTKCSSPLATPGSYTHFSVDTKRAALRIEHYYMKYRGFRHEYEPGEYYCFYCLAIKESWELDPGWEPICELLEVAEEFPGLWEGSERYEDDSFYSGEEFVPNDVI
ncbi:hypothetical protein AAWM_03313 [Aspergillus awamori]|uniref:Uncharacterized protein n=1 Tax=Aspergillus awamori TaxID=105351 RepID=A0A401KME8_ASPAW|nr:hypothetical protein AAWM_03313 [Aspergillus awamori]